MANKFKILILTLMAICASVFSANAEDYGLGYYNGGYTDGALTAVELDGETCLKFTPSTTTDYKTAKPSVNPDYVVPEKTILSFDVSPAQTHQYMFIQILGQGHKTVGDLIFSQDGKMAYRSTPQWESLHTFPDGNDAYSGYNIVDITPGEWYHIDIIFDSTNGTTTYFLDGEAWGTGGKYDKTIPLDGPYITARGGEGYNDEPTGEEAFWFDNITCYLLDKTTIDASMGEVDLDAKTMDIIFSEPPMYEDDLWGISVKNTVTGEEVAIENIELKNSNVKITYSGELEALTEYAVELPAEIVGKFGGISEQKVFYFHTKAGGDKTVETVWDYTENDLSFGTGDYLYEKTLDDGHGDVLVMASASTNGVTIPTPTIDFPKEDITYISFDLQPKSTAYPIGMDFTDTVGSPCGIDFNISGILLLGQGWIGDRIAHSEAQIDQWSSTMKYGKYNADEWVNIKIVNNQKDKELSFYVNDVLYKTEATTLSHFNAMRIVQYNNHKNVTKGTEMLYIDNVKVGYYEQELKVKNARFILSGGKEYGPFSNIPRDLNKVLINFQVEVAEESLNENTVKLFYGGAPVEYTALDFDGYTYTICPKTIPGPGDTVTVEVSGVYNENNKPVTDYKTVCFADSEDGSLMISGFDLVDTNGEVTEDKTGARYVKAGIYNTSNETKEVIVTLMGYNGEKMTYLDYREYTLDAGEAAILDESGYNEILEITGIENYSEIQAVVLAGGEKHYPLIAPIELEI